MPRKIPFSFGINYGLLIKELNLLARPVLIIDKGDTLRYFKIAWELASPVDEEAALTTHAAGGLRESAVIIASLIDSLGE